MPKRLLFIDRDGTLIKEAPPTYQLDSFDKLRFFPDVFFYLRRIAEELDFELVMVTNQDGLGTDTFPESSFWPVHQLVMDSFAGENIHFAAVHIDRTYPHQQAPTRKPGVGMLTRYLNNPDYDLPNSFVIGDRITDVQLAQNLGCKGIWINLDEQLGAADAAMDLQALRQQTLALETTRWAAIHQFLKFGLRRVTHQRYTNETKIDITLNLDGSGLAQVDTGLGFFNHMLEQIARHGGCDLAITTKGDLHIDEHHTVEDTAIALGEAIALALADKKGIERYGFCLPMDEAEAKVSLDFGGRSWLIWQPSFSREKVGDLPTELFAHFFKSFADGAKANLNIEATGQNEHHKIEAIFKAFAKAVKMAVRRDPWKNYLPSTKGVL
jgi:imidazoleglycerol-phosphate dehydratase / histidinol-phosphatase